MSNPQSAIGNPQSPTLFGIFGGSFDPVHNGHLVLAECCREQLELEWVWIIPASQQPLKPEGPQASNAHRVAMLEQAIADQPGLQISTLELDRGGVSFTADTLAEIHDQRPCDELFLLLGADSLADLPRWHRPEEICRLGIPAVVHRAGSAGPDFEPLRPLVSADRFKKILESQVEMSATPISSSQIRALIAANGDWEEMVPVAVAEYIHQHQLYRDKFR